MYMRELCPSPDKIWASIASSGNVNKASQHPLIDCSIWPFVRFTLIGDVGCIDMLFGESACKYCPDALLSAMADYSLQYLDGGN